VIAVTFFKNHAARGRREERLSAAALAELIDTTLAPTKGELPWLKLARFGDAPNPKTHSGSLRWDGNVDWLSGVEGDYDGKEIAIARAVEALRQAGIAAIVYPSPSWREDAPRWRVLCPFSGELPPGDRDHMMGRLEGLFRRELGLAAVFASESWSLSQSYYYGHIANGAAHPSAIVIEGTPLDLADELDADCVSRPAREARVGGANPQAPIEDIRAAVEVIPNPLPSWDLKGGTWDGWNTMGMAIWRASGGGEDGRKVFHDYSRKWREKYDEDETNHRWNHYFESPPDNIGFGTLVHHARAAVPGWAPPSRRGPGAGQQTIKLAGGNRPIAAAAGIEAIADAPFFQRDGKLVYVQKIPMKAFSGETVLLPGVIPVPIPLLLNELGKRAVWMAYDRRLKNWKQVDVPYDVATRIATMSDDWPFPPLRGVIGTPTMRADGSLLTEPGYDDATGFLLFAPPPMPNLPAAPGRADAEAALRLVDELFDEFPFANPASLSVALSLIMSLVLRPILPVVPLHAANSPEGGTGKSYVFDIASALALGEECPALSRGATPEETEKRLVGAALEGRTLIVLDNVNGELRSEFLCQAIERPIIQPRPLGTSKMPAIPNGFVCGANGNNIEVADDLVRRTLVCSLDANMEQPYLREFKRRPVADVLANRGRYVGAVLTIARAYVLAGMPNRPKRFVSFEEWSDLVRGSLIWLGKTDPLATMLQLGSIEPGRERLAAVFTAIADAVAAQSLLREVSFSTAKLIELSKGDKTLEAALLAVAKSKKDDPGVISPDSLGWWLKRNADRIAAGWKLVRGRGRGVWCLHPTASAVSKNDVPDF
jgi:putative DNA primase/helicase